MDEPFYYLLTLFGAFVAISALAVFALQFKQRFDGVLISELSNQDNKEKALITITMEQEQIVNHALKTLKKDKLYLDPKLRLSDFAKNVGKDPRELSRLLYSVSNERFPKHTMKLRVEHAKKLIDESLADAIPINLLNLSYQSGFNAKSSFNLAFKQVTGMSPSEYINHSIKN